MLELILVGGGHAHLLAVAPIARALAGVARVSLFSSTDRLLYSGMMPGWLAGQYRFDDCAIDLRRVCHDAGVHFEQCQVRELDMVGRRVAGRSFDLLSINVGSENREATDGNETRRASARLLAVKPFEAFVQGWHSLQSAGIADRTVGRALVVGSGAAGVELAFALVARGRVDAGFAGVRVTLAGASERLLEGQSARAARLAATALQRAGVTLLLGQRYLGCEGSTACFEGGAREPADLVVLATGARAPRWLSNIGSDDRRALADDGGLAIERTLRVAGLSRVFAAGDCASLVDAALPRSGVHAVRQAPVLADNLVACARWLARGGDPRGAPLRAWRPQRRTLALLNQCNGLAIADWGPLGWQGRWVWRWKQWLDRRFVMRFRRTSDDPGQGVS